MRSQRVIHLFLVGTRYITSDRVKPLVIRMHIRKRNACTARYPHPYSALGVGMDKGRAGGHHTDLTGRIGQNNVLRRLPKMLEGFEAILQTARTLQMMKGGPFVSGLFPNPTQGQQISGGGVRGTKPTPVIGFDHRFFPTLDANTDLKGVQGLPLSIKVITALTIGLQSIKIRQIPGCIGHTPGEMTVKSADNKRRPGNPETTRPGSIVGFGRGR